MKLTILTVVVFAVVYAYGLETVLESHGTSVTVPGSETGSTVTIVRKRRDAGATHASPIEDIVEENAAAHNSEENESAGVKKREADPPVAEHPHHPAKRSAEDTTPHPHAHVQKRSPQHDPSAPHHQAKRNNDETTPHPHVHKRNVVNDPPAEHPHHQAKRNVDETTPHPHVHVQKRNAQHVTTAAPEPEVVETSDVVEGDAENEETSDNPEDVEEATEDEATAQNEEPISRAKRVSHAGSSHRNRPSAVDRLSSNSNNNINEPSEHEQPEYDFELYHNYEH